jgi:hypothetical protein
MSEKIYALLLRLFPSHFREVYGKEALRLFRDRARDEKGFFASLRLWLDLLSDLAISVPREYVHGQPAFVGTSAGQHLDGSPAFIVLENALPRPGALLVGGVLSLAAVGAFWLAITYVGGYAGAGRFASGQSLDTSRFHQKQVLQAKTEDESSATHRPVDKGANLDVAERRRVVDGAIANLKEHYVYPDVAQKMADALLRHQKSGDDDAEMDGGTFAALLTRQMREVSPDRHLALVYSQTPLPPPPTGPTPEDLARYREAMEAENCTFEKVEILPRNIGYLKPNSFPDVSVCRTKAKAAMASLNNADAIIFDLRDNGGGEPEMVALMASYLFDHPEYWYNPRENTTQESWTRSPVPGNRLVDKPVYVLTSARTFSGAEQFCYDLKMLKRATLVGETTGGAAHSGVWHRIDDHFGMGIPETKPINPFGKADWAETGVEPDVKVKAADALETAKKLAESKLRKR